MKLLTNPGLVLGSFLVGAAIVGVLWLASMNQSGWQFPGPDPDIRPQETSVHEQSVAAIAKARKLAENLQHKAASDLLTKEAKRLSMLLVAEPVLKAVELNSTMILETAKIAELSLKDSSTNASKRQVAMMYFLASQTAATGEMLAQQFEAVGAVVPGAEAILTRCKEIQKEAIENYERLAPKRATDDLIPFPPFPNR